MTNTASYYEQLAFEQQLESSGNFLSGWQSINPFSKALFHAVSDRARDMDHDRYLYFDEDESLTAMISDLHLSRDGARPQSILCGSGSTALIFAFLTYLKQLGVTRVYYVPPIYFTVYDALERYQIELIPVAALQPFEAGFAMRLPAEERSVLLLSDPVWYTGVALGQVAIDELKAWQKATGSLIFVDGSLQYMSWEDRRERSAGFDPALTFRLLCPTKQFAANGYRFAYLLTPNDHLRKLSWIYSNIHGSASAESLAFAYEALPLLASGEHARLLVNFIKRRFEKLVRKQLIETVIQPDAGYFMFGKAHFYISADQGVVDGKFFGQDRFPGYHKINLLSPALDQLAL